MCYHQSFYFIFSCFKVFCIREHIIYTWSFFCFELNTSIYYYNIIFVFNNCHILANLFNTTKRNYSYCVFTKCWNNLFSFYGRFRSHFSHMSPFCCCVFVIRVWLSFPYKDKFLFNYIFIFYILTS